MRSCSTFNCGSRVAVVLRRSLHRRSSRPHVVQIRYNEWKGGGIIALSYEAKAAGVKRSMRGDEAKRLCPGLQLVTVPVKNEKANLNAYRQAGSEVFDICGKFPGVICQRTSIDEAYVDLTETAERLLRTFDEKHSPMSSYLDEVSRRTFVLNAEEKTSSSAHPEDGDTPCALKALFDRCGGEIEDRSKHPDALLVAGALEIARLREKITRVTGFTMSAGIAGNKLLAKLVSGRHKPDKQTLLPSDQVKPLLAKLPLQDLNVRSTTTNERHVVSHSRRHPATHAYTCRAGLWWKTRRSSYPRT